ncbi:MAG TPA: hypothetical protein VND90_13895 [Terracidiphilus sp.]|nr:hypothetical protein [Terracidiphilus sp.]
MSNESPMAEWRQIALIAWFLVFGLIELVVALLAAYVFHAPRSVLLVLLPTLLLMPFDPSTPSAVGMIVEGAVLFGGTFVLYGALGCIVGLQVRLTAAIRAKER